jgi:hypothetical protein
MKKEEDMARNTVGPPVRGEILRDWWRRYHAL